MVVHAFNPSLPEEEAGRSLSLRLDWFIYPIQAIQGYTDYVSSKYFFIITGGERCTMASGTEKASSGQAHNFLTHSLNLPSSKGRLTFKAQERFSFFPQDFVFGECVLQTEHSACRSRSSDAASTGSYEEGLRSSGWENRCGG